MTVYDWDDNCHSSPDGLMACMAEAYMREKEWLNPKTFIGWRTHYIVHQMEGTASRMISDLEYLINHEWQEKYVMDKVAQMERTMEKVRDAMI